MRARFLFRTTSRVNRTHSYLAAGCTGHEPRLTQLVRLLYALAVAVLMLTAPQRGHAGGPRYVAGVSYFAAGTKGMPLTWAQGVINYYTDQGDLSPMPIFTFAISSQAIGSTTREVTRS
jgi:hypothetical protein